MPWPTFPLMQQKRNSNISTTAQHSRQQRRRRFTILSQQHPPLTDRHKTTSSNPDQRTPDDRQQIVPQPLHRPTVTLSEGTFEPQFPHPQQPPVRTTTATRANRSLLPARAQPAQQEAQAQVSPTIPTGKANTTATARAHHGHFRSSTHSASLTPTPREERYPLPQSLLTPLPLGWRPTQTDQSDRGMSCDSRVPKCDFANL